MWFEIVFRVPIVHLLYVTTDYIDAVKPFSFHHHCLLACKIGLHMKKKKIKNILVLHADNFRWKNPVKREREIQFREYIP